MNPLRLRSACRYQVVPVRPRPFAPNSVRSARATSSVSEYLEDEFQKREIEEQRVAEGYPIDREPRFHAWCSKLTVSQQRAESLRAQLLAGDDTEARTELDAGRIVIDFANGSVLPLYITCARGNPNGNCAEFQARRARP